MVFNFVNVLLVAKYISMAVTLLLLAGRNLSLIIFYINGLKVFEQSPSTLKLPGYVLGTI